MGVLSIMFTRYDVEKDLFQICKPSFGNNADFVDWENRAVSYSYTANLFLILQISNPSIGIENTIKEF